MYAAIHNAVVLYEKKGMKFVFRADNLACFVCFLNNNDTKTLYKQRKRNYTRS